MAAIWFIVIFTFILPSYFPVLINTKSLSITWVLLGLGAIIWIPWLLSLVAKKRTTRSFPCPHCHNEGCLGIYSYNDGDDEGASICYDLIVQCGACYRTVLELHRGVFGVKEISRKE